MISSKGKLCSLHRTIRCVFHTICFVVFSAVILYAVTGYPKTFHKKSRNAGSFKEDQKPITDDVMLGAVIGHLPTSNHQSKNVQPLQEDNTTPTDKVVKRRWRRVGLEEAYVFSAYYKPFEHSVEMVGIVKRTEVNNTFFCLFSGHGTNYNYSAEVEPIDTPLSFVLFFTVYIRCTIPLRITPTFVTLEMDRMSSTLPIIFTKTKNLYNLSVCFPSFFRNYSDYGRLIDAIESNILFGVQFFTVYKHSVTDEVDKVFDYYVKRDLMEVINWNKPDTRLHHDGQWSHIQDCHLSHRYKSKYVMILDVDELIVPHKHRNLVDLIRDLEHNNNGSSGSFMFRQAFFDVDYDDDNSSFPQKQDVEQLHIHSLRHVWRSDTFLPPPERVKSIHAPTRVLTAGIHYSMKMVSGFREHILDPNMAYVHHYRVRLRPQKKVKDDYVRKFTRELVRNIKIVHFKLGFIK